ncbi:biopolymer transporter ExbD [Pirellulales bacterium]|nr:biopolymer transporter ExbD [Pirellulales bacterium]
MPLKLNHDEQPQLNLTPMIDVVFLLIIFFMVATKFTELERDIELNLPEVAQAAAMTAKPQAREVAVHADGRMTLDRMDVTPQELSRQLAAAKEEYPGIGVVIRGDAACPYCHVAEALAACQEARITDLSISVRVAEGASGARR